MSYCPNLSRAASGSVRRLAWALGKPMTRTLEAIIKALPLLVEPSRVCAKCKDSKLCKQCVFGPGFSFEEASRISPWVESQ
jgi:hypothetical protein